MHTINPNVWCSTYICVWKSPYSKAIMKVSPNILYLIGLGVTYDYFVMVWLNNNCLYSFFLALHVLVPLGCKFRLKLFCIWYKLPWVYYDEHLFLCFLAENMHLKRLLWVVGTLTDFLVYHSGCLMLWLRINKGLVVVINNQNLSCMSFQSHLHLWPSPTKGLQNMGIIWELLHGLEQVIWLHMT